jgi:hypothetical protein
MRLTLQLQFITKPPRVNIGGRLERAQDCILDFSNWSDQTVARVLDQRN